MLQRDGNEMASYWKVLMLFLVFLLNWVEFDFNILISTVDELFTINFGDKKILVSVGGVYSAVL